MNTTPITIQAAINAPLTKIWNYWNTPEHIMKWAFASADWEAPAASNDLRVGGKFSTTMAAKDKSASFEFEGVYSVVDPQSRIEYDMSDGRQVNIVFEQVGESVQVTQTFDPETQNSRDLQQQGWQSILNNFKKYVESN